MKHLSPETLLDIAEGTRPDAGDRHLPTCAACRERLAELRATFATVAAVDVPEPSPLFWDHLSARVREAAASEAARPPLTSPLRKLVWTLAAATSAAVIVIAVSLTLKTSEDVQTVLPSTIATDSRSGNADTTMDDPSLDLLANLAGNLDWDAAADAGMTVDVGTADEALTELTGAERIELQRLLHEAISGSGA